MIDFDYIKAHDLSDAIKQIAGHPANNPHTVQPPQT